MKNLGGRPRKGTLEEKKAIVDHYFVTMCAENAGAMQKRGIYRNLADFAQERGYDYAAHHFSRDPVICAYISSLTEAAEKALPQDILPVFVPLDLSLIIERSRDEIVEMLRDRDKYYEKLYVSANATLQPFRAKVRAYEEVQAELTVQLSKNGQLTEEKNALAEELRHAREEIAYLRSYIKKHVLPELAEAVFLASRTPKTAVLQATPYVTTSINQQTSEDRSLRVMAKETAQASTYEDLF